MDISIAFEGADLDKLMIAASMSAKVIEFDAGDTIVQQGVVGCSMFIILWLLLCIQHGKCVDKLKSGSYFGEIASKRLPERTATVQAFL